MESFLVLIIYITTALLAWYVSVVVWDDFVDFLNAIFPGLEPLAYRRKVPFFVALTGPAGLITMILVYWTDAEHRRYRTEERKKRIRWL